MSASTGGGDLYMKSASGASQEQLLVGSNLLKIPTSFSPDGRFLLYEVATGSSARRDLWMVSLPDRKASALLATEADEAEASFSPDGKWIVYQSDQSGRYEIYVRPFPGAGTQWQISTDGGVHPLWRADQKEILYESPDAKLVSVDVSVYAADFESGSPRVLFQMRPKIAPNRNFDISPDAQQILINTPAIEIGDQSSPVILVQNWTSLLRR